MHAGSAASPTSAADSIKRTVSHRAHCVARGAEWSSHKKAHFTSAPGGWDADGTAPGGVDRPSVKGLPPILKASAGNGRSGAAHFSRGSAERSAVGGCDADEPVRPVVEQPPLVLEVGEPGAVDDIGNRAQYLVFAIGAEEG